MPRLRLQALADVANILLRDRLTSQENSRQQEAVKQRQLEVAKYNKEQTAMEGEENRRATRLRQYGENPELAITASRAGDVDAEQFIQKDREIMAPAFEAITKAKNNADLPSLEALIGSRKPGIITNLNPIAELDRARTAQASRIADADAAEIDKAGATSQLQAYSGAMGKEEADTLNHPAQLGRKAKELGQSNEFATNLQRGLNPIYAARAGAEKRATLAPDIVKTEVDREGQLQKARLSNTPPTEGEANKAALWTTMVIADNKAVQVEKNPKFKGLGPALMAAMQSPTLASAGELIGMFDDPTERAYAQNAVDYASSLLYLRSGAQATAQEYARFAYNNFALSSDSPQEVKLKQQRRKVLAQANQVGMNKGKYQGGVALGRAIIGKQIGSVDFELDPEVLKGVNDVLSGATK